jgi:hypothetical protein
MMLLDILVRGVTGKFGRKELIYTPDRTRYLSLAACLNGFWGPATLRLHGVVLRYKED